MEPGPLLITAQLRSPCNIAEHSTVGAEAHQAQATHNFSLNKLLLRSNPTLCQRDCADYTSRPSTMCFMTAQSVNNQATCMQEEQYEACLPG